MSTFVGEVLFRHLWADNPKTQVGNKVVNADMQKAANICTAESRCAHVTRWVWSVDVNYTSATSASRVISVPVTMRKNSHHRAGWMENTSLDLDTPSASEFFFFSGTSWIQYVFDDIWFFF